jgi:type II secretory pathway pseudopilin PulG
MRKSRGFTYLGVLFLVALMGVLLATAGQAWHTQSIREKEAELLWVGDQYRKAIARFYSSSPGNARYPRELAELLKDPRRPDTQRYLRKLYADPVTGKNEWELVKAIDGGIAGVHSLSEAKPFKVTGFRLEYADFEGKEKYSDWRFVFAPGGAVLPPKPAGEPALSSR